MRGSPEGLINVRVASGENGEGAECCAIRTNPAAYPFTKRWRAFGSLRMNSSFQTSLGNIESVNRLPWFNILKIKLVGDSVRKLIPQVGR